MSRANTLTQTNGRPETRGAADTHLHGRWLLLVRIAWVVVVVLSLAVSIADIPLQFAQLHIACVGAACTGQELSAGIVQELHRMNLSVDFYAACFVILNFSFYLVWVVVAFVIFWRKSNDWMALIVALFLVLFPAAQGLGSPGDVGTASPSLHILTSFLDELGWLSLLLFFYLFPDGRFVPRWTFVVALAYVLLSFGGIFFHRPLGDVVTILLGLPLLAVVVGIGIFSQIYRYIRVSNRVQRQQTKWIVLGVTAAVGIFVGLVSIHPFGGKPDLIGAFIAQILFGGTALLIPLSIGFSILRYRLYDIDFLINRTLVYGSLTALLALLYFDFVFALQALFQGMFHQNNAVAIVVSTLAIAALFQPLRKRIQAIIDQRFYRRKYDAAKTVEAFNATLRNEVDLSQLREQLLNVVQETMQPAHVSLWIRETQRERKPES